MAMSRTWKSLPVILSAWKAKISTRVAKRAEIATGCRVGRKVPLNHSLPLLFISHIRVRTPAASGMTMKTTTEVNSTEKGTIRLEAPATRNLTMGANSTSMSRSFTDTCTSV
ncbi:MAG: hypothetical protein ACD_75C00861G0001 [uncultured bacterium]|nr:MAG: hypothetical protein ACD_75C00861G0001 [uncultured bacterium]